MPLEPARRRRLLPLLGLLLAGAAQAGGAPVGPGPITLPPITPGYDERCLDRIDKKDDKLAAKQSRECRKPRGSRNALPSVKDNTAPPSVR